MILKTLEIRWFVEAPLPSLALLKWFVSGAHYAEAERTDKYLVCPANEATGIKIRGQKNNSRNALFEIKLLTEMGGEVQLSPLVNGHYQQWTKYSIDQSDKFVVSFLEEGKWIAVKKKRLIKAFVVRDGALKERDYNAVPEGEDVCFVELCELKVDDATIQQNLWWSLGFEAYGKAENLKENLLKATTYFFSSADNFKIAETLMLNGKNSYAYPAWLHRLQ